MTQHDKTRVIELQRCLKIAKEALSKIANRSHDSKSISEAEQALEDMYPLEPKVQLQGLVGHMKR